MPIRGTNSSECFLSFSLAGIIQLFDAEVIIQYSCSHLDDLWHPFRICQVYPCMSISYASRTIRIYRYFGRCEPRQPAQKIGQQGRESRSLLGQTKSRAVRLLERFHERIANRRADYLHKTTTEIARTYAVVGLEDLPNEMRLMLGVVGFRQITVRGDYTDEPAMPDSRELVFTALR